MSNGIWDIEFGQMHPTLIDSLKATQAKLLADDLATHRGESPPTTEADAIAYIEQWYNWNSEKRTWIIDYNRV